ncbi:PDZ domain-containing protein [Hoeflea sp. TYP-13]|uniref:PDZ domain-containing protein n=1 Tax=Hoeflea sp. TYP-13 TaxID=3230023 RepID=UPI0034C653F5
MRLRTALLALTLCVAACPAVVQAQDSAAEIAFWNSIKDSTDPAEYEAYLETFPDGSFAALARIRVKKLTGAAKGAADTPGQALETPAQAGVPADEPRVETVDTEAQPIENDIGYVGLQIANLTPAAARQMGLGAPRGALVSTVVEGGPSDRAGLRPGDLVLEVGGFPVADMLGFLNIVKDIPAGTELELNIIRNGQRRTIAVTVGAYLRDNIAAAKAGDTYAMRSLYSLYLSGRVGDPDPQEALRWLNAAVDAGDTDAMGILGDAYRTGNNVQTDIDKALELYKRAADLGHGPSLLSLGWLYRFDENVGKDPQKAHRYLLKAAEAGQARAMELVAFMYGDGLGTQKNDREAFYWYKQAAEAGLAGAMVNTATRYDLGWGTAEDDVSARQWYEKALANGETGSAYNLAIMYENGNTVAKDSQRAAELIFISLKSGDEFAIDKMTTQSDRWSKTFRRHLQQQLKNYGVYYGAIDAAFGPQTRKAISAAAEKGKRERETARTADNTAPSGAAPSSAPAIAADDLGLGELEDFTSLD